MAELEAIVRGMVKTEFGQLLFAAVVCGSRFFGLLLTFAVSAWLGITGLLRVAVSIGLGIGSAAVVDYSPPPDTITLSWLVVVIMQEILAGSVFGVVLSAPIWIAQGAGDILDSVRGASATNTFEPMNATEVTVFGQFAGLIAIGWFATSGAFFLVWEAITDSFSVLHAGQVSLLWTKQAAPEVLSLLSSACLLMVVVSGPLLVLMLAADLLTGLVTRAARQFSLTDLSASLKCLLALVLLPIYTSFLFFYFSMITPEILKPLYHIMSAR